MKTKQIVIPNLTEKEAEEITRMIEVALILIKYKGGKNGSSKSDGFKRTKTRKV